MPLPTSPIHESLAPADATPCRQALALALALALIAACLLAPAAARGQTPPASEGEPHPVEAGPVPASPEDCAALRDDLHAAAVFLAIRLHGATMEAHAALLSQRVAALAARSPRPHMVETLDGIGWNRQHAPHSPDAPAGPDSPDSPDSPNAPPRPTLHGCPTPGASLLLLTADPPGVCAASAGAVFRMEGDQPFLSPELVVSGPCPGLASSLLALENTPPDAVEFPAMWRVNDPILLDDIHQAVLRAALALPLAEGAGALPLASAWEFEAGGENFVLARFESREAGRVQRRAALIRRGIAHAVDPEYNCGGAPLLFTVRNRLHVASPYRRCDALGPSLHVLAWDGEHLLPLHVNHDLAD